MKNLKRDVLFKNLKIWFLNFTIWMHLASNVCQKVNMLHVIQLEKQNSYDFYFSSEYITPKLYWIRTHTRRFLIWRGQRQEIWFSKTWLKFLVRRAKQWALTSELSSFRRLWVKLPDQASQLSNLNRPTINRKMKCWNNMMMCIRYCSKSHTKDNN